MSTKQNLVKFNGNKPLEKFPDSYYPDKYELEYYGFESPKEFDLLSIYKKDQKINIESMSAIVCGIKASSDEFEKYDFLCPTCGPDFVVHKRVLDKFNEICPNDGQALPIVIKNLDPRREQFENRNYYLINILNTIDMIDKTETILVNEDGKKLISPNNVHFKTVEYMGNYLFIREKLTGGILFHPSLAKLFIKSKGVQFLSEEELPDKPYRDNLWTHIHSFYSGLLKEKGLYEDFINRYTYKKSPYTEYIEKCGIHLNYCPNCGNLKKTPKARQCLKCMEFHDPEPDVKKAQGGLLKHIDKINAKLTS